MYTDNNGDLWVHERDYGENPFGDLFSGLFWILVGGVSLIASVFRRK